MLYAVQPPERRIVRLTDRKSAIGCLQNNEQSNANLILKFSCFFYYFLMKKKNSTIFFLKNTNEQHFKHPVEGRKEGGLGDGEGGRRVKGHG